MVLDPRWLEILKASGWKTAALAIAFGLFLLMPHWGLLPPLEPWVVLSATLVVLICGMLALTTFVSATLKVLATRQCFFRAASSATLTIRPPAPRRAMARTAARQQR
jgi:hypothetical protein